MSRVHSYVLKTIPHRKHRYTTCGDYWVDSKGINQIRTSDMGDWRYEFLVLIHEMIEWALVRHAGIKEEDITAFDIEFEKNKPEDSLEEPGDDPKAPYLVQHCIATSVERMMCALLGCSWKAYEDAVNSLPYGEEAGDEKEDYGKGAS